jgi:Trypsin
MSKPSPSSSLMSGKSPLLHPQQAAERTPAGNSTSPMFPPEIQHQDPSPTSSSSPSVNPQQVGSNIDPLEARPSYWDGRYEITPNLKYFARPDVAAEEEFNNLVPLICSMLRTMELASYAVCYSHVGYEVESSMPCILIIASDFTDADAMSIIDFVQSSSERKTIARTFTYNGTFTGFNIHSSMFQDYQKRPQPGSSIGSSAYPMSSFSLNCFFRDARVKSQQIYSITVHHGIRLSPDPITMNLNPSITIQQPSLSDHNASRDSLIKTIDLYTSESHSDQQIPTAVQKRREEMVVKYKNALDEHLKVDVHFGIVITSSGLVHGQYEGRTINEDWAVIAVDRERTGENYMRTEYMRIETFPWRPHNCYGQYVSGVGEIRADEDKLVRKWGRKTAVTTGAVQLVYSHVKLPGVDGEACEYTVTGGRCFSDTGDSGGPVLDEDNRLVGMILGGTEGEPKVLEGHERLGRVFCSYVTPINLILQRVEAVTGLRLEPLLVDLEERERNGEKIQWA